VLAVIWVMIQKAVTIGKAYNGEQSPLFVDLRGTGNFSQPLKFHFWPVDLWMHLEFCIKRAADIVACRSRYFPSRALPCLTTTSRAEPCPAVPSHARSVSLYYSNPALPNHAQPGLDFYALLCHTMPYLGLFGFFDIRFIEPTEHTAFLWTPVPEPNLAAGNVQPLKQMVLVDLLIIHNHFKRAGPGRIKLRPRP